MGRPPHWWWVLVLSHTLAIGDGSRGRDSWSWAIPLSWSSWFFPAPSPQRALRRKWWWKWWESDGKVMGKVMGKWWEKDGKSDGESDGKVMRKWWEKWWESDGKVMGKSRESNGKSDGKVMGKVMGKWWEKCLKARLFLLFYVFGALFIVVPLSFLCSACPFGAQTGIILNVLCVEVGFNY